MQQLQIEASPKIDLQATNNPTTNHTHKLTTPYGNGLAASKLLPAGSPILTLPNPNLLLIEKDSLQKVCSFCLLQKPSLKRCSGCKVPYFCSKSCQNGHWKGDHGRECGVLRRLPDVPPTAVRALVVLLLRDVKRARETKEMVGELDWSGLESHVEELRKEKGRWEEISLQARAAVEFTGVGMARMEEAVRLLCVLSTNAFRITLPDNTPIGLCFSPTLALANHSCTPNAFISFNSRSISLRALSTIQKDEQIFISYIDPTEAKELRQKRLKERYFFACGCEKCVGDEGIYASFLREFKKEDERGRSRVDILCNPSFTLNSAQRSILALSQYPSLTAHQSHASALLSKSRAQISPQTRIAYPLQAAATCQPATALRVYALAPYPEILHELYLAYIDINAFTPALIILLFLYQNSDVYTYPQPHHPVRVVRLFTIAKLLKHIASLTPGELLQDISHINASSSSSQEDLRARKSIAKVLREIDLIGAFHVLIILVWEEGGRSHGEESLFLLEVQEEIREVEEVQRLRGGGKEVRKWMGDEEDKEGLRVAKMVCEGLWRLGELMKLFVPA